MILLTFLITFLLTINSAFAASIVFDSLSNFFGQNGVYGLLQNDVVVLVLIYIAMLVGYYNLLKIATAMIFKNNRKEANTIAFVISFIGTTGIFFMYAKGNTPSQIVALFGGGVGLFLVLIVLISTLIAINRMLNNLNMRSFRAPGWYVIMGLSLSVVTYILTALIAKIEEIGGGMSGSFFMGLKDTISFLGGIGTLAIVIGIIMWLTHKRKEDRERHEDLLQRHPEVGKAEAIYANLEKDVDELSKLAKTLVSGMGK